MNHQEIFDTVLDHLVSQRAQSLRYVGGKAPTCAYRGLDGRKCAAGALIPDEYYDTALDKCSYGVSWYDAIKTLQDAGAPDWLVAEDNRDRIYDLQRAHDVGENWENGAAMWEALTAIATTYRLNSFKVDTTVSAIFPGYRHKVKA